MQVEVMSEQYDPRIESLCNIETSLLNVKGLFILETADGYTHQDVAFEELEVPTSLDHPDHDEHGHDGLQPIIFEEYVLSKRVTNTGWFLLQVSGWRAARVPLRRRGLRARAKGFGLFPRVATRRVHPNYDAL